MAAIVRFSVPTPITPTQTAFVRDYETAFAGAVDSPAPVIQQWIGPNSPFSQHTFPVAEVDPSVAAQDQVPFAPTGMLELDLGEWQARDEPSITCAGNLTLDKRTFSVDLSFEKNDDADGSRSAVYTEQYWRNTRVQQHAETGRPLLRCIDLPETDSFASNGSSEMDVSASSETNYMN